uniref:Uncharacterized protein n=1 Tax=Arundo donax TaxID=35708 RepID=A0A0A9CGN4_ARUDO
MPLQSCSLLNPSHCNPALSEPNYG